MQDSSNQSRMPQIVNLLVSHFAPDSWDKPKGLLERYDVSYKIKELIAGKKMKPIGLNQVSS